MILMIERNEADLLVLQPRLRQRIDMVACQLKPLISLEFNDHCSKSPPFTLDTKPSSK